MSPNRPPRRRRPDPHAWDHLWPLLPVFAVFVAMLVFYAVMGGDWMPPAGHAPEARAPAAART